MVYHGITFPNNKLVSHVEIRQYEKWFGSSFPKEYVDFLCKVNGGRPKPSQLSYHGQKSGNLTLSIDYFFGIRRCEYSLKCALETYFESGRIPKNFLPIASCDSADVICINIDDFKVYKWTDEGGFYAQNGTYISNTISITQDFIALLESIQYADQKQKNRK